MSEAIKSVPALLALLIGLTLALFTHNPIGLLLFILIGFAQYLQRNQALGTLVKFMFVAGAGLGGALTLEAMLLGVPQVILLCGLICAFCTSALYTRMKV